jgi:hypothetical protein
VHPVTVPVPPLAIPGNHPLVSTFILHCLTN